MNCVFLWFSVSWVLHLTGNLSARRFTRVWTSSVLLRQPVDTHKSCPVSNMRVSGIPALFMIYTGIFSSNYVLNSTFLPGSDYLCSCLIFYLPQKVSCWKLGNTLSPVCCVTTQPGLTELLGPHPQGGPSNWHSRWACMSLLKGPLHGGHAHSIPETLLARQGCEGSKAGKVWPLPWPWETRVEMMVALFSNWQKTEDFITSCSQTLFKVHPSLKYFGKSRPECLGL